MLLACKNRIYKYVMIVLIGVIIQIGASYLMNGILSAMPNLYDAYSSLTDSLSTDLSVLMGVYVMALAPLFEELVFRFILVGLLDKLVEKICRKAKNPFRFVILSIVSSALFGIYHGNVVQGVYGFILGLVLCYIFYYKGGYISSAIFHMSINISGIFLIPLLPDNIQPVLMIILGTVIFFISLLLIYKWIPNNTEKIDTNRK